MHKCLIIISIAVCLTAKTREYQLSGRTFQIKVHNINQIEMSISNYGIFGQTAGGAAGLWWPKGSGHNYVFGAGLWFGTVDSTTGDTLVTVGYSPHGGVHEFGPGLSGMSPADTNAIIYMFPDPWPPPQPVFPMAPQVQLSHQDSWCCMNDTDITLHVPGDTRPIGIEVYQTVYVWDLHAIDDIAFLTFQIKNISGHNLNDCYFGIVTDCDIGNESGAAANDRCTGIIQRPYFIDGNWYIADNLAYQWQEEPEAGWSEFPGVIGFDLLQTPFDLQTGQDKDNDGILDQYERDSSYYVNNLPPFMWDIDEDWVPDWRDASENPQRGMTALKRFTLSLEPNLDHERYLVLAGYNFQTGAYEPYDTILPPSDDQRFLMSSGPFDLAPDSIITAVCAIVLAYWHDTYLTPDTALVPVDYWAQHVYDHSWRMFDIEEIKNTQNANTHLAVSPNPLHAHASVSFSLSQSGRVSLKLYNAAGQLVKQLFNSYKSAGTYSIVFDCQDIGRGTYFLLLTTTSGRKSQSLVIVK